MSLRKHWVNSLQTVRMNLDKTNEERGQTVQLDERLPCLIMFANAT
jgi:hypothetical protein